MAKRATTKIETPSNSKLIISKSDFKSQIEERIQSGEELTKRSIQNSNDLELLQKDFRLWSDYNSELLKQSFDNPNNEYLKEYLTYQDVIKYKSKNENIKKRVANKEPCPCNCGQRLGKCKNKLNIKN